MSNGLSFISKEYGFLLTSYWRFSLKVRVEVSARKKNDQRFYGGAAHGQPVVYWCEGIRRWKKTVQSEECADFVRSKKKSVIIRWMVGFVVQKRTTRNEEEWLRVCRASFVR